MRIERILTKTAKEYIHKNHYSHGSRHAPSPCYGLYNEDELVGVCMFCVSCSENVRSSIFGKEYKQAVLELHRLHILDSVEIHNPESWFISKCLHQLRIDRPDIKCVIAFSDPTEGHKGTIYQATNAYYYGKSAKATFYLDENGRLHHPRQNEVNISKEVAATWGWKPVRREGKHRYFWIQTGKNEKKYWISRLKVNILPYP